MAVLTSDELDALAVRFQKAKGNQKDTLFAQIEKQIQGILRNQSKRYRVAGYTDADLYQECLLQVYLYTANYDPEKGSYAAWAMLLSKRRCIDLLSISRQKSKASPNPAASLDEYRGGDAMLKDLIPDPKHFLKDVEGNDLTKSMLEVIHPLLSTAEQAILDCWLSVTGKPGYDWIADCCKRHGVDHDIKGIDNGFSRIRKKLKDPKIGKQIKGLISPPE